MDVELSDLDKPATPSPYDGIPSLSSKSPRLQTAPDPWLKEYTKLMSTSIAQVRGMIAQPSSDWRMINIEKQDIDENPQQQEQIDMSQEDVVIMYEQDRTPHGFYTFKIHATLEGVRPDRLMYVIREFEEDDILEEFNAAQQQQPHIIRYVRTTVDFGIPPFKRRYVAGIDWKGFSSSAGTYTYIFRTTQHPRHRCDEKLEVPVIATVGAFARYIDGKRRTELIIVTHFNPGDSVPEMVVNYHKRKLHAKVLDYIRDARIWNKQRK